LNILAHSVDQLGDDLKAGILIEDRDIDEQTTCEW